MKHIAAFAFAVLAVFSFSQFAYAVPTDPVTAIVLKSDGGPPDAVALAAQTPYELQCKSQACAKFTRDDGGTQTVDCSLTGDGFILPTAAPGGLVVDRPELSYKFNSASANLLIVAALDAGQPRCYLYNDVKNIR